MDESKRVLPPSKDDRRSLRVPCQIPVSIVSPSTWPRAHVIDLSRTGVRLGLAMEEPGAEEAFSLARLAEMFHRHLAVTVIADLRPDLHGDRIRRGLRVVRIGPYRADEACLEVGCELLPGLDDEEARALGVELPREGESKQAFESRTASDAPARSGRHAPLPRGLKGLSKPSEPQEEWEQATRVPRPGAGRRAAPGLVATVQGSRRGATQLLQGKPLEFSREGGYVWVDICGTGLLLPDDGSVADRVLAFTKTFGQLVDLKISRDHSTVWSDSVRVVSVGIMPEVPGRLILGFTTRQPLGSAEARALGMPAEA